MKAYRLFEPGQAGLRCVDEQIPQPGAGEVLVRLAAASINYRDLVFGEMPMAVVA